MSTEPGGVLLVDKPEGLTSFDVVARVKGAFRAGQKIQRSRDLPKFGHGGTLDPFATGLLVVAVGSGTKLARYFLGSRKEYRFTMRFGATNAAGDRTEPVTQTTDQLPPSLAAIRAEAAALAALNPYPQVPPMHSAKKRDGKRLYELAREGIEVDREAVPVRLHRLEIQSYEPPLASGEVACSAGTYIRVLAQDLGRRLGSLALLEALSRTASGSFRLEDALPLDEVRERLASGLAPEGLSCWRPLNTLLAGMDSVDAELSEARDLVQGRQGALPVLARRARNPEGAGADLGPDSRMAIFCAKRLIAVAHCAPEQGWGLERVFPENLPA
ncbi:MAG: tRNA pseudouridine(55) synthase TruB [Bdellovibrionales bacterium]|nr:tRNA pseudouridine(55) synthase TruB [Bdellovibrionales bacterium]